MRPVRITCCLILLALAISAAGCGESSVTAKAGTPADSSGRLAGLDETVTAYPFQVAMVDVRYIDDPQPGPDMPVAEPVPSGSTLLVVELDVVLGDSQEAELAPSLDFELLDAGGMAQDERGFSIARSCESPDPSLVNWAMYEPLAPGEVFRLESRFLVDPDAERLVLRYWPEGEVGGEAIEFAVK